MHITSNPVGGSAHVLSDAAHAEQAQHDATNSSPESALLRQGIIIVGGAPAQAEKASSSARPEPPPIKPDSLATFVATHGLHPFARGQATATTQFGGLTEAFAHKVKHQDRETPAASHLDSMSEMGEMESLRLQTKMDTKSKLASTLSNILKKLDDTGDAIVQNMK